MKVVVIGGTGLIGKKLIAGLRGRGHEAVAASPSTGVNTLTGDGLAAALAGADAVVDVSNSPSFEDAAVLAFFDTSTRNLTAAAKAAGVKHFVALSIVGIDRVQQSGYVKAKVKQEELIAAGGVPYTIVRATQFHEFVETIVGGATAGEVIRMPSAPLQPIAADEVAAFMLDATLGRPVNGTVDIAGPEKIALDEIGRRFLASRPRDSRKVVTDESAGYFGIPLTDDALTPSGPARIGTVRLDDWLRQASAKA